MSGSLGPTTVASASDFGSTVARWNAELDLVKDEFRDWWKSCDRIERVYRSRSHSSRQRAVEFNVLWSNVETLKPAIYARPPIPVVARSFQDSDPVGRAAAMILRRTIQHEIEAGGLDGLCKQVRNDYLLYGRGCLWARYEAEIGKPVGITESNEELGETVESEAIEWDFVRREDFLHSSSPSWQTVTWVARRVRMTREDGVKRFGEKFRNVPLNYEPEGRRTANRTDNATYDVLARAVVYEIWDKRARKVVWIADSFATVLDEVDDPLKLRGFFPCPRPLFATLTDSTLVPVPDYQEYGAQAEQLDELTRRIRMLTKSIKASGVYNSEFPEIRRIFQENSENELVPVKDYAGLSQKGGLTAAIELLPVLAMAQTLETLINARAQVKSDLYEITGISDVIRGAETLGDKTATEIRTKGRYATLRLSDRQAQMADFVRDTLRITGEIIAEHFTPETMRAASNWDASEEAQSSPPGLFEAAVALLRNDRLRGFKIDIEDKSTIVADEDADKAARIQFLEAVGGFIERAITIPAGLAPVMAPAMAKMMMFGVRGFPIGMELETVLEDTVAKLQRYLEQKAQQPPQPDPETIKAQAEAQRMQGEMAMKQAEMQASMQIESMKAQAAQQKSQAELQIAGVNLQIKQIEAQMAGIRLNADMQQAEAQNAQDTTEHLLKMQDADLAVRGQDHTEAYDWAKLGLDAEKVDASREMAEAKEPAD